MFIIKTLPLDYYSANQSTHPTTVGFIATTWLRATSNVILVTVQVALLMFEQMQGPEIKPGSNTEIQLNPVRNRLGTNGYLTLNSFHLYDKNFVYV